MFTPTGCLQIQPNKFPDFQEISRTHLTQFQEDVYTDRASKVLQCGIQTHALLVMYDIMNKTAQKWSNDSFSGLKT